MTVRRTIRTAAVAVSGVLALGLSACSYDNPTDMVYNPPVGVNSQDSDVDVLNALVVKAESTSDGGTLVTTLVNNTPEEDRLTGVTPGAEDQGVEVSVDGLDIPGEGLVNLAEEGPYEVSGEPVQDGAFITLTFTFANAEAVTVDVPVVIAGEGYFDDVPTS